MTEFADITPKLLLWSKILKVISFLIGIPFCLFGFLVGIIGIGPDGFVEFGARLVGIIILLIGIVDCSPNRKLLKFYKRVLFLTLSPIAFIYGSGISGVIANPDLELVMSEVFFFIVIVAIMFLPAPLSLLFYKKSVNNQIDEL
jgi:hypothetical protein